MLVFRRAAAAVLAALLSVWVTQAADAQTGTQLDGIVRFNATPVANATVELIGNNLFLTTSTNHAGAFSFPALSIGQYTVRAHKDALSGAQSVDLGSGGAVLTIALMQIKEIGSISVARTPNTRGAGTDLTLNRTMLTRAPGGGSLPELLLQVPGAARGANGVIHINGDHGDINYIVDGVPIPQELNRSIGTEFDTNDIAFAEILEGAYPAQYGDRFASVVNVSTRTGTKRGPELTGAIQVGSFAHVNQSASYHTPLRGGSLVVAIRNERSARGLDSPNPSSPHNEFSNANQFLRFTTPRGNDSLNVTMSHSYHSFQIPNDVANGAQASTDDNETQDDLFAALQYRHAISDRGSISFGPAFKRSRIRDFGDPNNDFAYGQALYAAGGGAQSDCANALVSQIFSNGMCAYSLLGDRTARDFRFNADYALRSGAHEVRAGISYDITSVQKRYMVTLQPGNFLAPVYTPQTPGASVAVLDNAPNTGHNEQAYLQDSWKMGPHYQLDYGLRVDSFQAASAEFRNATAMFSPRIKLTRTLGTRASAYAFYGRFFTPFSLENVSPAAAQQLNLPNQPSIAAFDLKPQRDSVYEVGAHLPLGRGDLGIRVMQKNVADLIDDTQVGVTLLHQDINYQLGRIAVQSAYYQLQLQRGGRFYAALNHTYSVNKGCETQLLAPCFGSPVDWTPADHEQRWGATAGGVFNDARGGWFSIAGEYGSGLSSASCPSGSPGVCKRTPHTTVDIERGIALGAKTELTLRVGNLLDDHYFVTLLNAQGNHYASPRTLDIALRFR